MNNGFGIPGNMKQMMEQAQAIQKKILKVKEDAGTRYAEASSGGGMVKAVVNGKFELISLAIDKQVVNPDEVEMLQDLILSAVAEAYSKVKSENDKLLEEVTGGIGIPGLF
ncbi:MAG TPA: YbaB/EbfC family nucleoid-associated protein [Oligoflexia bacterium]|nr:YbaB/EbfC family nucleoid-associated protein [Oligoflexia bacterium]HMP27396.1 YbaB/EbfC family nucleoid-associated protein [Oligoflexia bacterium]